MAYTYNFAIALGASKTGLTLSAQLVTSAGVNQGSLITSGFVEIGGGNYLLSASLPDAFRGGVKILSDATLMAFGAINPEDAEYVDVKISSRQVGAGAGAISTAITINDGSAPLDGVDVWVSTDLAGSNVVIRGTTNTSGQVTFLLDPGDYYCWKQLAGHIFTNPESFTVS